MGSKKDSIFELPPLSIHGATTTVERMTQTELRTFIPVMLRYSTGRGKPGWSNKDAMPPWWPKGVPWENVKSDTRSEEEKIKFPWTDALRQVVINCYQFHGREDLLPFHDPHNKVQMKKEFTDKPKKRGNRDVANSLQIKKSKRRNKKSIRFWMVDRLNTASHMIQDSYLSRCMK